MSVICGGTMISNTQSVSLRTILNITLHRDYVGSHSFDQQATFSRCFEAMLLVDKFSLLLNSCRIIYNTTYAVDEDKTTDFYKKNADE